MEKIKIFLVDDHELVRDGLKALLSGIPDIRITGEAASGKELFEKLKKEQPDILILDISLPDISGIEILKMLSRDYPGIRTLVLSMHTGEEFILGAVRAGARGYLPKNTTREELLEAIHAVKKGEEFYNEAVSRILLKSFLRTTREHVPSKTAAGDSLSEREREVICLCAEGFGNREVAARLKISIRTVETHKNHIMRKLGLKSSVELVKFAIRNKMIEI
jgi:DNA-binding NarL/FixJ family response regulator